MALGCDTMSEIFCKDATWCRTPSPEQCRTVESFFFYFRYISLFL